jgi:hypothetical protein
MKTPSNDWNQSAGKDDPDEDRKPPTRVRPPPPRPTTDNVSGSSTRSGEETTTNGTTTIDVAFRRVRNRSRNSNEQVGVTIELVDDDDNNTDGVDSNPVSSGLNSLASSTACMSSPQQFSSKNKTTTATAGDDPIQNNIFKYPYVGWWGRTTTTTASPLFRFTSSARGTTSTMAKEANLHPTLQFQPNRASKQPGGSKVITDTVVNSRTTTRATTTTTEALAVADASTNSASTKWFYTVLTVIRTRMRMDRGLL